MKKSEILSQIDDQFFIIKLESPTFEEKHRIFDALRQWWYLNWIWNDARDRWWDVQSLKSLEDRLEEIDDEIDDLRIEERDINCKIEKMKKLWLTYTTTIDDLITSEIKKQCFIL